MATIATGVEPETNPEVERLLREGRAALVDRMTPRERVSESVAGAAFVIVAVALALIEGVEGFDVTSALIIVIAHGAAGQVRFEFGGGWGSPTILVLIPALFLEPPASVPLLIAVGCILARVPDYVRGTAHPEGIVSGLANAWHSIGPAVVLAMAIEAGPPNFDDAGWYLVAFASYVAVDMAAGLARQWAGFGVRPDLQVQILAQIYALDALLAPIGLMAALADAREQYAFLLAVPLVAVLGILARERGKRFDNALALSESRARVLEAELEATRARVEVLGAVSHGLQTPVAGIVAIAGVLRRRGPNMTAEALVESVGHLEEDAVALRHLIRQGLDYVRLIEGADLPLRPRTLDAAAAAAKVVARTPGARLELPPDCGAVPVRADAARVDQVLTVLVDRAMRVSVTADVVRLTVRADETTVTLAVHDDGPPVDGARLAAMTAPPQGAIGTHEGEGAGVDLYVAAEIVKALGGTLGPAASGGGLALRLPAS
ncbi:MAG: metal dependent phosphohydrolase [Solirubrobacterales bacterium]|nr:metal dependent phosphohydrolase [Solirubrobacterales bacterium]